MLSEKWWPFCLGLNLLILVQSKIPLCDGNDKIPIKQWLLLLDCDDPSLEQDAVMFNPSGDHTLIIYHRSPDTHWDMNNLFCIQIGSVM